MNNADAALLAQQPRVDEETISRFATCCRALGIAVHQRKRPADLAAARTGFTALTRIAHDQCDAWTGLAAAGDVSPRVLEAVSRTAPSAGVLQRRLDLQHGALGFQYDTGLYLRFRATDPDDFHLAYAAQLAVAGRCADAHQVVIDITERRPSWHDARWVTVAVHHHAGRWSDVVKLLTPIVNDPDRDELFTHAAKIALGIALARLGMYAP
ncbi:MAG TPA: type VII secretion AAA-ATPase EccA, partial [Mycobacterium sp.]|nr:type VII secretion AAA-ATPase EccA [Mycobacterium sp.]